PPERLRRRTDWRPPGTNSDGLGEIRTPTSSRTSAPKTDASAIPPRGRGGIPFVRQAERAPTVREGSSGTPRSLTVAARGEGLHLIHGPGDAVGSGKARLRPSRGGRLGRSRALSRTGQHPRHRGSANGTFDPGGAFLLVVLDRGDHGLGRQHQP